MNWQEKIQRCLGGRNASELAISVGLPKTAIRNAVNSGQVPGVKKALKISRALGVPCDWLFDDEQGWPPPGMDDLTSRPDWEIVHELVRRRDRIRIEMEALRPGLTDEFISTLGEIAARPDCTPKEQATLDNGLRLLVRLQSLHHQLDWLSPDQVKPPEQVPPTVGSLIRGPHEEVLRHLFLEALCWIQHTAHPDYIPAEARRQGVMALIPPRTAIVGTVHPCDELDKIARISTHSPYRYCLPLLKHPERGIPVRGEDGRYPKGDYDEMVVYRHSSDPRAFGYRLERGWPERGYPPNTILICEPGAPSTAAKVCLVLFGGERPGPNLLDASTVLHEHPEYEAASTERDQAGVYVVIDVLPPKEDGSD